MRKLEVVRLLPGLRVQTVQQLASHLFVCKLAMHTIEVTFYVTHSNLCPDRDAKQGQSAGLSYAAVITFVVVVRTHYIRTDCGGTLTLAWRCGQVSDI